MTALGPRERTLYARHLLLPELGSEGQLRLLAAEVRPAASSDEGALSAGLDYLRRAGVRIGEGAECDFRGGTAQEVEALAGRPELIPAAQALRGAFAAVEAIKAITGAGVPAPFPAELCLSSEEA